METTANIRFWLDGCDIHFLAEAPEDITLKELLKQCDRIQPDWCLCGIKSYIGDEDEKTEILFTKDDVIKIDDDAPCKIHENDEWYRKRGW